MMNSTTSDTICTACETPPRGSKLPWLGCMEELKHLELTHGKQKALTSEFFPLLMRELKILNFSHNQISTIGSNTFRNLPNLTTLDLSYNKIERLEQIFGQQRTKLEFLDLRNNAIKVLGAGLIPVLPKLKAINLSYNRIVNFTFTEWRRHNDTALRFVDLTGNPINCDCHLGWVNGTFSTMVHIAGNCATPDEFKESRLRVASRSMIERCDIQGQLGTRAPAQAATASSRRAA